jgi:UDPglucose 6-dehydrogenase
MEALWKEGATVRAYDPKAMEGCRQVYGERNNLVLCESQNEALEGADALILATEWKSFQTPDFESIRAMLKEGVIFDGRNIYDLETAHRHGICVYGVGRGTSLVDNFELGPTAR